MPMHMVGFYKSVLTAGTLQPLPPIPDSTVTVSVNDLFVPDKYNQLLAAACLSKGGTSTQAQLRSPSLREMFFPEVNPQVIGANFDNTHPYTDWFSNPVQLITNEGLNFYSDAGGDGSTTEGVYGIVNLGAGKISPASGKMYSIRASSAAALSAGKWVQSPIAFDQTLPVGNYDIVGMRCEGSGLVAARLLFIGASAITRPGALGVAGSTSVVVTDERYGSVGIYGTFNSITQPSVECLGDTGTSQTFVFDLIKRG